ncbi:MAG: hypothetical protein ACON5H_12405 [Akkermansiaceae bacterium]
MKRLFLLILLQAGLVLATPTNLQKENLVAWCIVPFDASQRSPEERAKMLNELGIKRCAYDWRKKHIPEFEEEILQYQKHGIEYFAFWGEHPEAFRLFEKHQLTPQIWKMFRDPEGESQEKKVAQAVEFLKPLAKRTAAMKCKFALYNHGGWSGEPANLVAVCKGLHQLGFEHVGIVYNWHHGQSRMDHWKADLTLMKPFLHCLNLNGMKRDPKDKILPIGKGDFESKMLGVLIESDYKGAIGILDHRNETDAKIALRENFSGLADLMKQFERDSTERPAR